MKQKNWLIALTVGLLFCFSASGQSWRKTPQIQIVDKNPFGNYGGYFPAHTFERKFDKRAGLEFTQPDQEKYRKAKVKTVSLYNTSGTLFYRCELDALGQVVETGILGRNYFITRKVVQINPSYQITKTGYYKEDQLMKLDSVIIFVHKYEVGDTILTYHEKRIVTYMMGSLVNEKNDYLNERYLNKKIETPDSDQFLVVEPEDKKDRKKVYLKKELRTDYDSLAFINVKDVRYFNSAYHKVGDVELNWEDVSSHPFFELVNQKMIENCLVDGACFEEPMFPGRRNDMICGYGEYQRRHYNDGKSYGYTKRPDGLFDTYYLDYYPVDPNPPKQEEKAVDTSNVDEIIIIEPEMLRDAGPRRLSTPERSIIYEYRYTFFD